jgi:DNA-binding ferritin-like protein
MDLTELTSILEIVFASNFVARYRSHVAHINIKGRNFYQDHKLLKKVYQYFEDQVDPLGEKLRTLGALVPSTINEVMELTQVNDFGIGGPSEIILASVVTDVILMIELYHELHKAAELVGYTDISNMADDNIGKLAKFKWQIEATLRPEIDY